MLNVAITADLPAPAQAPATGRAQELCAAAWAAQLKIAFPPDGARIDLGLEEGARDSKLGFEGARRLAAVHLVRQWRPGRRDRLGRSRPGAGRRRLRPLSVTDAKGASDAVTVEAWNRAAARPASLLRRGSLIGRMDFANSARSPCGPPPRARRLARDRGRRSLLRRPARAGDEAATKRGNGGCQMPPCPSITSFAAPTTQNRLA